MSVIIWFLPFSDWLISLSIILSRSIMLQMVLISDLFKIRPKIRKRVQVISYLTETVWFNIVIICNWQIFIDDYLMECFCAFFGEQPAVGNLQFLLKIVLLFFILEMGDRGRESHVGSMLSTEPDTGLDPTTPGPQPEVKGRTLNHWVTQVPLQFLWFRQMYLQPLGF